MPLPVPRDASERQGGTGPGGLSRVELICAMSGVDRMRRVLVLDVGEALRRDLLLGLRRHGIDAEAIDGQVDPITVLGEGAFGFVVLGPSAGPVRDLIPRLAG